MAEFLIYDKVHGVDTLTPMQLAKYAQKYPKTFQIKYDAHYQKGDIIEVREDGFYTNTLKGDLSRWPFRVVQVTGMKPDKKYMTGDDKYKRLFNIPTGDGKKIHIAASLQDITLIDKNG